MPRPDNVVTVATWSVVSSGPGETSAEMGAGTSSLEAFSYRNWVCPSVGNTAVSNLRCYDDDDDGGGGSLPAASTVHEADAHATAAMVGTSRAVEMPKGKPGEAGRDVGGRGSSGALAFAMVGMAVVFAEL
ncbi:hypothetical protein K431DRAFT_287916 [Polychaeton citri CBS 116435]|uniref:Uncharacterized protein n=1 Tax=Polychaeton citri CBS 116435 TaxID=1314669 RepID=A0A9P4UJP0_9PEZI|nr:hypothetical protein K431DRAFT_287916 [Polychaeton citri CBS 116435]